MNAVNAVNAEPSPFAVVARGTHYRLRRYFPGGRGADGAGGGPAGDPAGTPDSTVPDSTVPAGPPVLLVPPMMITAEIYDVSARSSAAAALHRAGVDVWVIDFGDPRREPGGRRRNLSDHVLGISDAVDQVRDATGSEVILGGYSQGGMFAYQAAALRRGAGIDSLITFGAPADVGAQRALPVPPRVLALLAAGVVRSRLFEHLALPWWGARAAFVAITPLYTARARLRFLRMLPDRPARAARERQRRFLVRDGWTGYAGPAIVELLEKFVVHPGMLGGFAIDDRPATLADLDLDVLIVFSTDDRLGAPDAVRAITRAAPRARVYELAGTGGHFGLVVGTRAEALTWPAVAGWVRWRRGEEPLPAGVNRTPGPGLPGQPARRVRFGHRRSTIGARMQRNTAATCHTDRAGAMEG